MNDDQSWHVLSQQKLSWKITTTKKKKWKHW